MDDKQKPEQQKKRMPWFDFAKKYEGKKETDPVFGSWLSGYWKYLGLPSFKGISGSLRAWCGLSAAACLIAVGLTYEKDGASAMGWDNFGVAIAWKSDGIPQGAFIRLNHKGDCSSASNNHITQADGYCTANDLLKPGATFNGYGGNQGDTWKVSTYSVKEICAVRWPKEYPKPAKVLKSVNCTGAKSGAESTR